MSYVQCSLRWLWTRLPPQTINRQVWTIAPRTSSFVSLPFAMLHQVNGGIGWRHCLRLCLRPRAPNALSPSARKAHRGCHPDAHQAALAHPWLSPAVPGTTSTHPPQLRLAYPEACCPNWQGPRSRSFAMSLPPCLSEHARGATAPGTPAPPSSLAPNHC